MHSTALHNHHCSQLTRPRLGKPRKNRNPDGSIMRDVSPAGSYAAGSRPGLAPRTPSFNLECSPEPTDSFFFGPTTPDFQYQETFVANAFEGGQSPPYSEAGSLASGWSNDEQMMFQNSANMFAPMPQYPAPPSPFMGRPRASSAQPEMFPSMDSLHSPPLPSPQYFGMAEQQSLPLFTADTLNLSPTMITEPLPSPSLPASVPDHDCTQFAFQILNTLYAPPSSQPSVSDFSGAADGLPTLDAVLSANKAAVDKLFALLNCSCSANPHFSTTIAFTIVKILSWYQAIAGANRADIISPINTRMEAFTHTPISLGAFKLELEDEETFRTQIILGELRKVEKLIDTFSERYCKKSGSMDIGIDTGVYGSLESLLRTRVRDTFKVTMRTAPVDVKRQIASRTQNRARVYTM
jgi:hypothetical protein